MKIVNLKKFLSMPAGTVFCKYEPCFFDSLAIKGENCGQRDFFYQQLAESVACRDSGEFAEILHESQRSGSEVSFDFECESRDGCFDDGRLFAVWSPDDVRSLISRLQKAIQSSTEPVIP